MNGETKLAKEYCKSKKEMEYKYCLRVFKENFDDELFFYEHFPSGNRKINLDNIVRGAYIHF